MTKSILCLLLSGVVFAQAANSWAPVVTMGVVNTDEVSMLRMKDGTLHVVWPQAAANKKDMMYRAMDADGKWKGEAVNILPGWNTMALPALLQAADGSIELYLGGVKGSEQPDDPYNQGSLYKMTASSEGDNWRLVEGAQSASSAAGPIAALAASGEQYFAFPQSTELFLQRGIGPDVKPQDVHGIGCCPYEPQLAADSSTGEVVVAWYSNADKQAGLLIRTASGSLGELLGVPGSVTTINGRSGSLQPSSQIPIRGRIGAPGIYAAYCEGYPSCRAVNLWELRSPKPQVVAKMANGQHVNLSAAPEGRLWVMWEDGDRPMFTRSNKAVTRFGPVQTVPLAPAQNVFRIKGDGIAGPLDAFVNIENRILHAHILPPLQLTATPSSIPSAAGGPVTLSVSDVGDPVAGATITIAGQTLTSDAQGRASYSVPKGAKVGSINAEAVLPRYQKATATIRVQ